MMMLFHKMRAALLLAIAMAMAPAASSAYPTETKATLKLGFGSTVTGMAVTSDDNYLYTSYADVLKRTDLGLWALTSDQPPPLTSEDGDAGNIGGIGYLPSNNYIYAPQDTGNILTFYGNDITARPAVLKPEGTKGKKLGPVAIDTSSGSPKLFMVDNANSLVYIWKAGQGDIDTAMTVNLKLAPDLSNVATAFNVLDILYNSSTDEVYVATDVGIVAYFSVGNTGVPLDFVLDETHGADIAALAVTPDGSKLYAATGSQLPPEPDNYPTIYVISTSTHQQMSDPMRLRNSENSSFESMAVMTDPSRAVYGYASGSKGVTVFNTSSDRFVNIGDVVKAQTYYPIPTSNTSGPLIASDDLYLYLAGSGNLLVITENPWVTVLDVVYKDATGAVTDALKTGGSCEITFRSDTAGDYSVMVGGNVNRTGKAVKDISGSSTGPVAADTDTRFEFRYDDNSGNFQEGDNPVYFFVTSGSDPNLKGRAAANVKVDTPPGEITISGTGFGDGRAYLTFSRLTANDISHYNLYADTDAEAVRTKTDVSGAVAQTSAGNTVTGVVNGLTNNVRYYLAVEGVDRSGQSGPRAYLLNGSPAYAVPQVTVGPAGYSGEKGGCSLVGEGWGPDFGGIAGSSVFLAALAVLIVSRFRRHEKRRERAVCPAFRTGCRIF